MSRIAHDVAQVLEAAGIGKLVEGGDPPVWMGSQCVQHKVTADEPGAPGHEYLDRSVGYHRMPTSELSPSMKR